MADFSILKDEIVSKIKKNGNGEITGEILQQQLLNVVDQINLVFSRELTSINNNIVVVKGDLDNTAILKGEIDNRLNKAISQASVAVGAGTTAGLKGWYYGDISKVNDKTINVYLTVEQKIPTWGQKNTKNPSSVNLIELLGKDAIVSLVNDSKYDNKFKIVNGRSGMVQLTTVDNSNIPFTNIVVETNLSKEDYSIYHLNNPIIGEVDLAVGSFAEGYMTEGINGSSHAEGYLTKAHGKFSHAEGRETVALYAAHAEGQDTKALGTRSHAEGYDNVANGNGSHVEGQHNITNGQASHSEGYYTLTQNVAEHAEGKYNVSTKGKTIHSVGIGTSESDRKNAHEITIDGKHYIYGIGGYDGISIENVTDVASVIKSMQSTIQALENRIIELEK